MKKYNLKKNKTKLRNFIEDIDKNKSIIIMNYNHKQKIASNITIKEIDKENKIQSRIDSDNMKWDATLQAWNFKNLNVRTWENEECNYNGFITFNSASEFDVYDLGGNVWEWTNTISPDLHVNDPKSYIQKGGSFLNIGTSQAITNNNYSYPEIGLINFGFRCVRN